MQRLLACVSLVAATTTAVGAAVPPAAHPSSKPALVHHKPPPIRVAPADEYFGKLKLSVLGIRNTIKDVGANLDIDQTRWAQLASKAAFAEDAMHDWERKYPQDTWLAKTVFALERMYAKLDSDEGRRHAIASMQWLVHDFPRSWYGKTGRKELALGKVGHPPQTAAASASPAPDQMGQASAAGSVSTDQSSSAGSAGAATVTTTSSTPQPAPSVLPQPRTR